MQGLSIYADNIAWEQSQYNAFEDCSNCGEVLEVYYRMVWQEHLDGVKQNQEPNYFLGFVEEAQKLKDCWAESGEDEDVFLEKAKDLPGDCFDIAETIVSGDYSALLF